MLEKPGPFMRLMQWLMPKLTPAHVRMYRYERFGNRQDGTPFITSSTFAPH